jgi:hypothetical protein
MALRFYLREHQSDSNDPGYYAGILFNKNDGASLLRVDETVSATDEGDGYVFIVINRTWLHGKYIRWNWQGTNDQATARLFAACYIYDGEYDRTSSTDFPDRAALLTKGNGKLQTLSERTVGSPGFSAETVDVLVDTSGGSQTNCTLFFKMRDAWTANKISIDLDWVEINTSSGGSGNLYSEHFTDSVTMEVTGTYADYGYISTGTIDYGGETSTIYIGYLKF